jgi:hypothetical protein
MANIHLNKIVSEELDPHGYVYDLVWEGISFCSFCGKETPFIYTKETNKWGYVRIASMCKDDASCSIEVLFDHNLLIQNLDSLSIEELITLQKKLARQIKKTQRKTTI